MPELIHVLGSVASEFAAAEAGSGCRGLIGVLSARRATNEHSLVAQQFGETDLYVSRGILYTHDRLILSSLL